MKKSLFLILFLTLCILLTGCISASDISSILEDIDTTETANSCTIKYDNYSKANKTINAILIGTNFSIKQKVVFDSNKYVLDITSEVNQDGRGISWLLPMNFDTSIDSINASTSGYYNSIVHYDSDSVKKVCNTEYQLANSVIRQNIVPHDWRFIVGDGVSVVINKTDGTYINMLKLQGLVSQMTEEEYVAYCSYKELIDNMKQGYNETVQDCLNNLESIGTSPKGDFYKSKYGTPYILPFYSLTGKFNNAMPYYILINTTSTGVKQAEMFEKQAKYVDDISSMEIKFNYNDNGFTSELLTQQFDVAYSYDYEFIDRTEQDMKLFDVDEYKELFANEKMNDTPDTYSFDLIKKHITIPNDKDEMLVYWGWLKDFSSRLERGNNDG